MKTTICWLVVIPFATGLFAQQPGDLDSTFGANGIVITDLGGSQGIRSVVIQNDGKIIAGGHSNLNATGSDFTLIRYNQDGSIDSSFGINGSMTTDFAGVDDELQDIVLQPDGKIVAVGYTVTSIALARYLTDGSPDTSFSMDGKQLFTFGFAGCGAWSMALQPDGKIIAAGYTTNNPLFSTQKDFALVRCSPDGSLDSTFSGDGILTTRFVSMSEAYSVIIQTDGKIIAAGYAVNGGENFALARYNTNGTLDSTFSADGILTTDFDSYPDRANSVALQNDAKIVVAGYANSSASFQNFALARYNTDGTLDSTFSSDGKLITTFGGHDIIHSVIIQPDGKIVAAGETGAFGIVYFSVNRYLTDGTLDNSFSADGKVTTPVAGGSSIATSSVLQRDGKIVVAGGLGDFAVIRYISGLDVLDIQGAVLNEQGVPVPRVTITLSGDDSQTVTTDSTGRYNFTVAQGGSYTVTPSKNNDVVTNNGITSLDVLLMRKHILGIAPLSSPYKVIAATEVNAVGDTTITTQDILFTRSLILGNITSFPTNRLWQFVSSDYVFPDNNHPFPFPTSRTYTNITTNQTGQDFIGIKLGDVNGSWAP